MRKHIPITETCLRALEICFSMPTDISLLRKIINYKTLIISVSFFGVLCNCVMNTVSSFSCWVFWILCNLYLLKDVTFFRVREVI